MIAAPVPPERIQLDRVAAAHRTAEARARAYITKYLQRGAIVPPGACEHCGLAIASGKQVIRTANVVKLHAWHPDPARVRDVAWLCTNCRNYARASGEPIELHWQWPGGLKAIHGRPRRSEVAPEWLATAQAASQRSRTPGLSDELFFVFFSKAAGRAGDALFAEATRISARGAQWQPTGIPSIDEHLRKWAAFVRACHAARPLTQEPRIVDPVSLWERRPRIDRALLLPKPPEPKPREPFDEAKQERRIAKALDQLEAAEAALDALLARIGN